MSNVEKSLSYKILISVILCSSLFALLATAFSLYLQYLEEYKNIDKKIYHIESSYLDIVGADLYKLDKEHLNIVLNHIIEYESVVFVQVKSDLQDRKINMFKGTPNYNQNNKIKIFTIKHLVNNRPVELGQLIIAVSYSGIHVKLLKMLAQMLSINMFKTFLASFCIVLIINYLLTRHLKSIATYLKHIDPTQFSPLLLNRKSGKIDELDQVVKSFNSLHLTVKQSLEQQKKIETDLKKTNLAKAQFLANIGHELRTPICNIQGLSELAKKHNSLEYIGRIDQSGKALLNVMDNIIDMAQFESKALVMQQDKFSLKQIFDELKKNLNFENNDFDLSMDPSLKECYQGDKNYITKIFQCLIDNSIKFTTKGVISLYIAPIGHVADMEKIQFCLSDTGIGISDSYMTELFLPFTQEDSSLKKNHGGAGLGLAIVKHIVDALGGTIDISSKKHMGTTTTVILSLQEA
ncbi:MAG: HAMP domain-containing histidine kinase [Bacteriovoracaceae bacterium]|nr:HAMP domain-containing histidine kinase [Bacteriovoracaceae bacterium]